MAEEHAGWTETHGLVGVFLSSAISSRLLQSAAASTWRAFSTARLLWTKLVCRYEPDPEIDACAMALVHRLAEIDWMVPAMTRSLLFDDLDVAIEMRDEHDLFTLDARRRPREGSNPRTCWPTAKETPSSPWLLNELLRASTASPSAWCAASTSRRRVGAGAVLIEGSGLPGRGLDATALQQFFELQSRPNYFFRLHPQWSWATAWSSPRWRPTLAERELLLARTLFEHHPALAGPVGHSAIRN